MALARTQTSNKTQGAVNTVGNSYGERRLQKQSIPSAPPPAAKPLDQFAAGTQKRNPANLSEFNANATYKAGRRFAGITAPYKPAVVDAIERGTTAKPSSGPVSRPTDAQMLNFLDRIIGSEPAAAAKKATSGAQKA